MTSEERNTLFMKQETFCNMLMTYYEGMTMIRCRPKMKGTPKGCFGISVFVNSEPVDPEGKWIYYSDTERRLLAMHKHVKNMSPEAWHLLQEEILSVGFTKRMGINTARRLLDFMDDYFSGDKERWLNSTKERIYPVYGISYELMRINYNRFIYRIFSIKNQESETGLVWNRMFDSIARSVLDDAVDNLEGIRYINNIVKEVNL